MAAARTYAYSGALATHMDSLVKAKRAQGYDYSGTAYWLWRLDRHCVEVGFAGASVTRELAASWAAAVPGESGSNKSDRMGALRQLALYELSAGIDAYVPRDCPSVGRPDIYLPTREETKALFAVIDSYEDPNNPHMPSGYRVAFRLMRLCGLRISECANMAAGDVDCARGTLMVRHSKGDKDRIVYMADDVAAMVADHQSHLRSVLGYRPDWLFPGRDPSRHILKTSFDYRFASFWDQVSDGRGGNARPTPHALRHAFVVERMNAWAAEGVSLEQMMPYLAAYLGHLSSDDTFYYYHQVQEAFSVIRERDSVGPRVIPGAE